MKKVMLCSFLVVCSLVNLSAQGKFAFKVDSASVLNWAGGIAGRMGTSYTVYLSWKLKAPTFTIDSVWSNGYGYAVNFTYERGRLRDKKPAPGRKQRAIKFAEDKSVTMPNYNNPDGTPPKKPLANPPIKYSGKALIRYIQANGKKRYIVVKNYTSTHSVNYP